VRERGGGSWAALASWAGRGGEPAAKKKEREESCWAGPRGEGERFRGLVSLVFFSKTFQIFSNLQNTLKLHTNKQNTLHSNYDAQALIASKLLK
jgi:hypothetical protein